ncbi:hypothetical protein ACLKA6_000369 [Drosophila palustris]
MRTRLSIHISILAFGLVLWQLQSVLAQKYYMNFAFNNNNPDANGNENGGGESQDMAVPGGAGLEQPDTGESNSDDDGSSSDSGDDDGDSNDEGSGDDNGDSGSGESGSDSGKDVGKDSGSDDDSDDSDSQNSGVPGMDDDNDDSDSHDAGPRPFREEAEDEDGPDNDHSHHSSYEISIDDSFGGRYVRSIYESSESHGHSGSNAGSGSRGLDQADSSDSKEDGKIQTYGADDYEEYNDD